jgi:hypothetical protein
MSKFGRKELEKLGNNLPSVGFLLAFLFPPYNLCKFCCQYFKDIGLEEAWQLTCVKCTGKAKGGGRGRSMGALPK